MTKIAFARICIEVNADKALPDSVLVRLAGKLLKLRVDYQWKPEVCRPVKEQKGTFAANKDQDKGKSVQVEDTQGMTDSEGFTLVHRKRNSKGALVIHDVNQVISEVPKVPKSDTVSVIDFSSESSSEDDEDKSIEETYEADVSNPPMQIVAAHVQEDDDSESEASDSQASNGAVIKHRIREFLGAYAINCRDRGIARDTPFIPCNGLVRRMDLFVLV
ncbi:hypothetical protein Droror1_Dr00026669 [Drosera rotundifolia]